MPEASSHIIEPEDDALYRQVLDEIKKRIDHATQHLPSANTWPELESCALQVRMAIELKATKVEGQAASLAERVSRRLGNDGALTVLHAAPAIRHQLDTTAAKLWADGHVTVGALWRLYEVVPFAVEVRGGGR